MTVALNTSATAVQPSVTSTGIGSGLDITSLVSSLVTATIQPQQTLLTAKQTKDQATISALATVKSALSSLQDSVDAITTGSALGQLTAQTSDSSVFSATASTGAVAGSYQLQVTQLAQANTISSTAFTSSTALVGAGSYAITAGGKTFSLSMASSSTLADLRNAINGAADNAGVSATIVNSTDGAHLLLSATQTGTANAVSIASPLSSFSSLRSATDAQISIDGYAYTSSTNVVSGALDGVTLNLASASPNSTQTLTVSADQQSAASAIQSFVTAYNAALSTLNQSTAYTAASATDSSSTGSSGPLLGDLTIQRLSQQLQTVAGIGATGSGTYSLLSQIGITEGTDGTLTLDTTKLNSALQSNLSAVNSLFSGSGGIGTQMNTLLNNNIQTGGTLDSESTGVQNELTDISGKLTDLTQKQADLQARYLAQFNAMDTLVGKYKSIASFLTTYSNSLNNASSSNK